MTSMEYLKILVEDIHSTAIATIDQDGKPVTRIIDMMLYDENGLYFLTAKGKEFYDQLMEQKYISLSSIKEKRSISLHGDIRNIGHQKLEEIFEKNPYMQKIYPEGKRDVLEVFHIYHAKGQFFDISDPSHIERGNISIGVENEEFHGYLVKEGCVGCATCVSVCPQNCIVLEDGIATIQQNHCLHCGKCMEVCPVHCIQKI